MAAFDPGRRRRFVIILAARERAALGASMGLPGMQERVRLVGGQMLIESAPGQGTAIHIDLPLLMKGA